jgi:hypothetical protein
VLKITENLNMSDDLVRRLRCYADIDDAVYNPWVYGEAADHIEKLEAALREIAALGFWDGDSAMSIARKALEGKDD